MNVLQTSTDHVISHIIETLHRCDYLPGLPLVQRFPDIPEMIIIHSIDKNLVNLNPNPEYKEVSNLKFVNREEAKNFTFLFLCFKIIVDATCGAAVLRGAHIYCAGVLGMLSNTKIDEMVNIFADIEGTCRKGTNKVYASTSKLFVGIGQIKMQRFQLFGSESKGIAVRVNETISGVPSIGSEYLMNHQSLLQVHIYIVHRVIHNSMLISPPQISWPIGSKMAIDTMTEFGFFGQVLFVGAFLP